MYDKDFAELVKIAAEKLKEDTVYKMLTRSEDYQKESDERDKAERNYEQLDLTMEQRKVCDVFLDFPSFFPFVIVFQTYLFSPFLINLSDTYRVDKKGKNKKSLGRLFLFFLTLPQGERLWMSRRSTASRTFKSTLPQGERYIPWVIRFVNQMFKSTLPQGERQQISHNTHDF